MPETEGSMTKTEIVKQLDDMAITMRGLAIDMEYYFGFSPWARHAQQLLGASFIAEEWATEIRKEAENDNNVLPSDAGHVRNRPAGNGTKKRKIRKRKTQKRQPKAEGIND
jgi:hypothetical protein